MALLFILLSVACSEEVEVRDAPILIPENQATAVQNEKIQDTLLELTEIMKELGVDEDLTRIPIVVLDIEPGGQCFRTKDKNGIYIVLDKEVVDAEPVAEFYERPLFATLLHEIGHCYFGRSHTDEKIQAENKLVRVNYPNASAFLDYYYLPISAMHGESTFPIPKNLKKYYVGEVIGAEKAAIPEDLSGYAQVSFMDF